VLSVDDLSGSGMYRLSVSVLVVDDLSVSGMYRLSVSVLGVDEETWKSSNIWYGGDKVNVGC
jgi:hypothetical protein